MVSGSVRHENGCGPTSGTTTWYAPPGAGSSSVTVATPTCRPSDDSEGRRSHCCCTVCGCPRRATWTGCGVNGSDPGCEYQMRQPLPPSSGLPGMTHVSTRPPRNETLMLSPAGSRAQESCGGLEALTGSAAERFSSCLRDGSGDLLGGGGASQVTGSDTAPR